LEKLKFSSTFWHSTASGVVQFEDFWPTIAENVQVYRSNVSHLSSNQIHLEDENIAIPCDILLLGTGFKTEYPFFDSVDHARLGLPQPLKAETFEWQQLSQAVDKEIIAKFPLLRESTKYQSPRTETPFRLYNAIAPIEDRSIAFVGSATLVNMFLAAEVQALWASAVLDGTLELPSEVEMKRKVARDCQWSSRRYPYYGKVGNSFTLECIAYCDELLRDLGLTSHIRDLSWYDYWTKVNFQDSYKGCIEEYLSKTKLVTDYV
jgi:dimethylaniline monooxygenase (N-oxide forming)